MAVVNLDLAVSFLQLAAAPTIAVGLPTSHHPQPSESPFTKIIEGLAPHGFYAANAPAERLFGEQTPWERWSSENKAAVAAAGIKCWQTLQHRSLQEKEGLAEIPRSLPASSETVVLGYTKTWSPSSGKTLDFAQSSTLAAAWEVTILATSRDVASRLLDSAAKYDDWIMVLSEAPTSSPTSSLYVPRNDITTSSSDPDHRRPSLGTNGSSSTIYSIITDQASTNSKSSNRRIEIKSGVPNSIRALSEGVQVALPADGLSSVKTAWTSTTEAAEREYPTSPITSRDPTIITSLNGDKATNHTQTSEETTLWDDFSVAPVNAADLVNLAIHSPVGMVLATPELRIYWVNTRWYEITKVERGQDLNSWIDGIHPESLPILMDVLQGLMESKDKRAGDIKWKDGAWSTFTAQVLLDPEGNVTAVAATIDDCTQRKNLELAQLENHKVQEAAARYTAEEASARAKELAEWQSQRRVLECRTRQFAQMAEISSVGLTFAKTDGEIIWGGFHKASCRTDVY